MHKYNIFRLLDILSSYLDTPTGFAYHIGRNPAIALREGLTPTLHIQVERRKEKKELFPKA
jgi:hypothetical protein